MSSFGQEGQGKEGKSSYMDRKKDQEEIKQFISETFKGREKINFEEYKEINTQQSSEMIFTVMQ